MAVHTFDPDIRIRVQLCSCGDCGICPFIVILAIDFVAVLVNQRGVSTDDISLEPCMFDSLVSISVMAL